MVRSRSRGVTFFASLVLCVLLPPDSDGYRDRAVKQYLMFVKPLVFYLSPSLSRFEFSTPPLVVDGPAPILISIFITQSCV